MFTVFDSLRGGGAGGGGEHAFTLARKERPRLRDMVIDSLIVGEMSQS